ncbi:MAG: AzlC family ABC transporter permease [Lentisphaeria bacterium]|nr:AzlC family ABC transporter permease [Lentisphaeria bacterium]
MIKSKTLNAAFLASLPVLMGYVTMGMAAGILLSGRLERPDTVGWAFLTSASTISGALQFAIVDWISRRTALVEAALLTFCLNVRYAMYGLSLLERFRGVGWGRKAYLIWTLTDETYALEVECKVPPGGNPVNYCLAVAGFNHFYWVAGVTLGAWCGRLLPFSTRGIDFAMTALFLVILTDQCRERRNRLPALIGGAAATVGGIVFGSANMLIPAMALMLGTFLVLGRKLEAEARV